MRARNPCARRREIEMRRASDTRAAARREAFTPPTWPVGVWVLVGPVGTTTGGLAPIGPAIVNATLLGTLALPWLSTATAVIVCDAVMLNGAEKTTPLVAGGGRARPGEGVRG